MSNKRELLSPLRAAVDTYQMIQAGDNVAVGVSGGKDSVALLVLLARLRRFYPRPFTLTAITIDPCFNGVEGDYTPLTTLCRELGVPLLLHRTKLWEAVTQHLQGDETPCSICARLRRGTLYRLAVEAGCHTVALGHHQDDAAQTALMNLFSGATLSCFSPKSYLDRRGITLIRPMLFLREHEIEAFVRREQLPVIPSRCPADGKTHRQEVKELLNDLSGAYGDVSGKITAAWQKAGLNGWGILQNQ